MKPRMYLTLYVFAFGVYVMFCLNCRTDFAIYKVCLMSYGQVLLQTNTSSVTACSTLCAPNLACRSVMYDPNTTMCTLSSRPKWTTDGQPKFPKNCTSRVYYGMPMKHTCLDKWLLDPCDSDADCPPTNSACIANKPYLPSKCLCKSGYPYNFRNNSCLSRCDEYGVWSVQDIYFIVNDIFEIRKVQDDSECSELCYDSYASRCRQVLYIESDLNFQCYLSSETALTKPDDKILITSYPYAWTWIRGCA